VIVDITWSNNMMASNSEDLCAALRFRLDVKAKAPSPSTVTGRADAGTQNRLTVNLVESVADTWDLEGGV